MELKHYEHYPVDRADVLHAEGLGQRLRVETVNWTLATEDGHKNHDKVHRNVYETTLGELVEWIRDTDEVAEDIVRITPLG